MFLSRRLIPYDRYRKKIARELLDTGLFQIKGDSEQQPTPTPTKPSSLQLHSKSVVDSPSPDISESSTEIPIDEDDVILSFSSAASTAKLSNSPIPPKNPKDLPGNATLRSVGNPYLKKTDAEKQPLNSDFKKDQQGESNNSAENNLFSDELEKLEAENPYFNNLFTPMPAHENLTDEDLKLTVEESLEQANTTLEKAMEAFNKQDYSDALDLIKTWFDFDSQENDDVPVVSDLLFLQGKCEVLAGYIDDALVTWKKFFNKLDVNKNSQEFTKKIQEVRTIFEEQNKPSHAIPFLFLLLDKYRKSRQFKSMDKVYDLIAKIYHRLDDRENLVGTYKNQLSIKKELGDTDGQLHLLDLMGKIYFDMSDSASSRMCYQESIKIKKNMLDNS